MYRTSAKLVRYLALRLRHPAGPPAHHRPRQRARHHRRRPCAGCTGTRARTGTGRTTSTCCTRLGWTPAPRPPGWSGSTRTTPPTSRRSPAASPPGVPCAPRGSSSVVLRSAPSADAPLVNDIALRPDGTPNTMDVSDHGARASAGQTYALAGRQGDWTAIWYLGQRAWFHNPASAPTASWTVGVVATPKPGRTTIPVYGRAYPEQAAYPDGRALPGDLAAAVHPGRRAAVRRRRGAGRRVLPGQHVRRLRRRATGR